MEDPVQMGMGFMPAITMGVAGKSGYGISRILEKAEKGQKTVKGTSIAEKARKLFRPKYEGKLFTSTPGESGVGGVFHRAAKQPAGEVPQGVKVAWSGGFLEGEVDFLKQLEKVAKAKPGEGYKIMKSDPVISKYAPKWGNPLAREPVKTGVYQSRGQEFLSQTIEEGIPSGEIKLKSIAEQRKMFIKFASGVREFVEHMEGRFKIRIRDLSSHNIGIRKDGSPIFYDFGINETIGPNFFKKTGDVWEKRSTRQYWEDSLRSAVGEFSPAATPSFDLPIGARLKGRKFTTKQLESPDFWKKLGDRPQPASLEKMAKEAQMAVPPTSTRHDFTSEELKVLDMVLKGGSK